jgi:predicted small lipoprotein YifL
MTRRVTARHGPLPPPRAPSCMPAAWIGALVALLALWLAGCGFRGPAGGPPVTAAAPLPDIPTVEVVNPFLCPGAAP